jgi:hypothetical protein
MISYSMNKIESFDQAHSGRCPKCGMMDKEKNHLTHRYFKGIDRRQKEEGQHNYIIVKNSWWKRLEIL